MARRKPRPVKPPVAARVDQPGIGRAKPVDVLRGVAILAMIVYHFAFDLRFFRLIEADFEHGTFWLTARALIVGSFLALAGISLVLASRNGMPTSRFLRRIAVIAVCALLASAASYAIYPQTFIYFGVLHCIAVSSLLARPLVDRPRVALIAGIAVIAAGLSWSHAWFDTRFTSWLGFTTHKPPTQDFVPLAPWLGVMLVGIGIGNALVATRFASIAKLAKAPTALAWMGRHSLAIYMIHQPVLLGLLWLLVRR